jgi:hypothetical protein
MSMFVLTGWIMTLSGTALWFYGYFGIGHPPLVDWHSNAPWWIAEYLPNIESEVGLALAVVGMVPIYWPARH